MKSISRLSNAKVLFQDKQYSLECTNNGKKELCLIDSKGRCNWIILYSSGKLSFDYLISDTLLSKVNKYVNLNLGFINS
jgi:hypothetical protein